MSNIIQLRTPTGGTSTLDVTRSKGSGVEIKATRQLADGAVRQESCIVLNRDLALHVARRITELLGDG